MVQEAKRISQLPTDAQPSTTAIVPIVDGITASGDVSAAVTSSTTVRAMTGYLNVRAYGVATTNTGAVNDPLITSAVAAAGAAGAELFWPEGSYPATATIPLLHTVRHRGPGVILRSGVSWPVEPVYSSANALYVATTGSSSNDGLTSALPLATIQQALDAMRIYGPYFHGTWTIHVAAGTYTNQPVSVEGYRMANAYLTIRGPNVSFGVPTVLFDGTGASGNIGMFFSDGMKVLVRDIKIQNWTVADATGVLAQHRTQLYTYNVHVDNVDESGIYAQGECRLYVQGGIIENCSKGIRAAQATTFTIGQGAEVVTCRDCEYGAHLRNQSGGIVVGATFQDCTVFGVQLLHSSESRFSGCTFSGNAVGINVTGSAWYNDTSNANTFSGNTVDVQSSQHSGELNESFEYFYEYDTKKHGWGGASAPFTLGPKYHFRHAASGGSFHSGAHMGLEAATPVFSFLTDNVSATANGGFYWAKPGATSIGQLVYRYDDNSIRVTLNNVGSYRFNTTGFTSNTDNSLDLGSSGVRWNQVYGTQFHFGSGGTFLTSGAGTPEGAITAPIGSLYTDTVNGDLYRKTSGAGNTGWVTP